MHGFFIRVNIGRVLRIAGYVFDSYTMPVKEFRWRRVWRLLLQIFSPITFGLEETERSLLVRTKEVQFLAYIWPLSSSIQEFQTLQFSRIYRREESCYVAPLAM